MEPFWVVGGTTLSYVNPSTLEVVCPCRDVYLDTIVNRFGSILNATLFKSEELAEVTAHSWRTRWSDKTAVQAVGADLLLTEEVILIQKHQLKKRAKALFGLRVNSPIAVIADRYEDMGMIEEASLLRS